MEDSMMRLLQPLLQPLECSDRSLLHMCAAALAKHPQLLKHEDTFELPSEVLQVVCQYLSTEDLLQLAQVLTDKGVVTRSVWLQHMLSINMSLHFFLFKMTSGSHDCACFHGNPVPATGQLVLKQICTMFPVDMKTSGITDFDLLSRTVLYFTHVYDISLRWGELKTFSKDRPLFKKIPSLQKSLVSMDIFGAPLNVPHEDAHNVKDFLESLVLHGKLAHLTLHVKHDDLDEVSGLCLSDLLVPFMSTLTESCTNLGRHSAQSSSVAGAFVKEPIASSGVTKECRKGIHAIDLKFLGDYDISCFKFIWNMPYLIHLEIDISVGNHRKVFLDNLPMLLNSRNLQHLKISCNNPYRGEVDFFSLVLVPIYSIYSTDQERLPFQYLGLDGPQKKIQWLDSLNGGPVNAVEYLDLVGMDLTPDTWRPIKDFMKINACMTGITFVDMSENCNDVSCIYEELLSDVIGKCNGRLKTMQLGCLGERFQSRVFLNNLTTSLRTNPALVCLSLCDLCSNDTMALGFVEAIEELNCLEFFRLRNVHLGSAIYKLLEDVFVIGCKLRPEHFIVEKCKLRANGIEEFLNKVELKGMKHRAGYVYMDIASPLKVRDGIRKQLQRLGLTVRLAFEPERAMLEYVAQM
ncbi:uncharacterized protein LOC128227087 [Mya arenaria]|uniref:uncharacterized protein LOC128227087 n=1 Tax=Mya arenaria TaxID=6604 RepID=UPI0022E2004D|nr:uncharacterized protein LOC128227087 [Mya arenaria]